jgi:putative peptidoglycan lipid II flippase
MSRLFTMNASRVERRIEQPRMGRLAGAALLLSASLLLSRFLGVARIVFIADIFGNTRPIEAYFAAFRIPDTMFMLVSGGALASAFVPVFAGLLEHGSEREAWRVASSVLNTVSISLAVLAALSFLLAPQIMAVLVGGYTPAERGLTVDLTRIMLLQPIFLGASAVISSILQTYHRFVLTAIAPLIYNLAVVCGALLGHSYGVGGLAWSVVIGACAQLLVQLPGLRGEIGRLYRVQVDWQSTQAREIIRLFVPRVVGLAAFQAMLFITLYLAAGLPRGNVAAINYSWLLISFPVGALGTAAATAIFPTLARLGAAEDLHTIARTVNRSLRPVLFLSLPAAVGLIVLRRPIINLLYNHGDWTSHATEQTAFALLFYAMALAPLATIEVFPRVFYALKDTIRPVRIAIVTVALDAVLSILFVHLLPRDSGQGGLALATAIATTVQALWLASALDVRLGGLGRQSLTMTLRDAALASAVMALVCYVSLDPLTAALPQHGLGALVTVAIEVALGGGTFVAVSYLVGAPELWQVRSLATRGK